MAGRTFALDPGRPVPGRLTPWSVARAVPVVIGWVVIAASFGFRLIRAIFGE